MFGCDPVTARLVVLMRSTSGWGRCSEPAQGRDQLSSIQGRVSTALEIGSTLGCQAQ
ncbi:MAG: hypothetical protein ACLFM4_10480 [Phormidium sp.]